MNSRLSCCVRVMASSLIVLAVVLSMPVQAATLENSDFETGNLSGWDTVTDGLTIEASTNNTFNRNYAARIHGDYSSASEVENSISQTLTVSAGDDVSAVGFVCWQEDIRQSASAEASLTVSLKGPTHTATAVWTNGAGDDWFFFDLTNGLFGAADGGYESGTFDSWEVACDDLTPTISSTHSSEGNHAFQYEGAWTGWSFNQAYQIVHLEAGDRVAAKAKVQPRWFGVNDVPDCWMVAGIKLESTDTNFPFGAESSYEALEIGSMGWFIQNTQVLQYDQWFDLEFTTQVTNSGDYIFRTMVCGVSGNDNTNEPCVLFDDVRFYKQELSIDNPGFEDGTTDWVTGADSLTQEISQTQASEGTNSFRMVGTWSGWNFNAAHQSIYLHEGDQIEASAKMYIDDFENSSGWAVTGIKLEQVGGSENVEDTKGSTATEDQWLDLGFSTTITNAGEYVFRAMVCGDVGGGTATADIYFDDMQITRLGEATSAVENVTLDLTYKGFSGGANLTNSVDIYFDSVMFEGSTASLEPATNIFVTLMQEAAAIAADTAEDDIPPVVYPELNSYGFAGESMSPTNFPVSTEVAVAGWRFRHLTNDVTLTMTNVLDVYGINERGPGYIEVDQYIHCARFWHTARGEEVMIDSTNTSYFTLGTKDNSSSEFGEGPFSAHHVYTVGEPLTNFPRRIVTAHDGQWPDTVEIVFQENVGEFERDWDKYFILTGVDTNGEASGVKALKVHLNTSDAGNTNLAFSSQELHLGWASEESSYGKADYPNCTYQDHNEVAGRAGWLYGLLDGAGWFMSSVARGSATIEPIDLFPMKNGNWSQKTYEEYLFTWPNAGSMVRSVFDDDYKDRIPGPASYHVGFKIGHQFSTNEYGEPKFPGIIEIRGNGYYRMTDYDGVMGGSFRPVSADIFGIYQGKEDAPLIPAAYTRLAMRSTPTNEPDDSYTQIFMPVRSKTNHWFIGAVQMDAHFAPDEVENTGAYFDHTTDIYANKAVTRATDGPLNAFAQVDMYWRGSDGVNDHSEGHDFDALMVQKADGEWITHHPINPPTNIYHRVLSDFEDGDTVYIMQQDRAPGSYGFSTEAPYRKVSNFEITMLDDGGHDLSIDLYEQNTISEINDNCVVACPINEDIAKGQNVKVSYRYRGVYAPGVSILNPNDPSGDANWNGNTYTIDLVAADGEDMPISVKLYYGDGTDDDWTRIDEGELLYIAPFSSQAISYDWDVSGIPAGAYYVKAEVQRLTGGKVGFDISDARLQIGSVIGFENNGSDGTPITNDYAYLGDNMGFENGNVLGWASAGDHLTIYAGSGGYQSSYAARMTGSWSGWSWNNLQRRFSVTSNETLHVTGKIKIDGLVNNGTNWVAVGIGMQSTNEGAASVGVQFDETFPTGVWMNVDFYKNAADTDGEELLTLWCSGYDGGNVSVLFDDIQVLSTAAVSVVTNPVKVGYWEGDSVVDVTAQNSLAFDIAASEPTDAVSVWVADSSGVTNSVNLDNYIAQVVSQPQAVSVPWSAFTTISKTSVKAIGFNGPAGVTVSAAAVRSVELPLLASTVSSAADQDTEQLGLLNPGETITNIVTIQNTTASDYTGMKVQIIQEYATNVMWMDHSHGHPRASEATRRGDRLCGDFEQVLTGITIPANGSVTITNVYTSPAGKLINHREHAIESQADWYIGRNYQARTRVHVIVRDADGNAVLDDASTGIYSTDDDGDLDNDGMSDDFETTYGGDKTSMDPDADLDNDGYSNLTEYQAGTDPTSNTSLPGSSYANAGRQGYAEEMSYPTLCAEMDNINIPIYTTNANSYRVSVKHPRYLPTSIDDWAADFTDCTFAGREIWMLGSNDDLNSEFNQNYGDFANHTNFYAQDAPAAGQDDDVSDLPKELNNDWLYDQRIYFTADEDEDVNLEARIGSTLKVEMCTVGGGILEVEAYAFGRNGWTNLGSRTFATDALYQTWDVPDLTWAEGTDTNCIRLRVKRAQEGGNSTAGAYALYDYIELRKRDEGGDNSFNPTILYQDTNTIVETVHIDFWWRYPEAMTINVDGGLSDTNAHYLRLKRRIPGTENFTEVFVLYEDGNARVIPYPQVDEPLPYGASIILGPTTESPRPYAEINTISVNPDDLSLDITYGDNSSSHVELTVGRDAHVVDVTEVTYDVDETTALTRFRSMWVIDGKSDMDRVTARRGTFPIMDNWSRLHGSWWDFYKEVPSYHNTDCPEFFVELMGEDQGYLNIEAEDYSTVSNGSVVTSTDAYGGQAVRMTDAGGELNYSFTLTEMALDSKVRIRYSDADGSDGIDSPGNVLSLIIDGASSNQVVAQDTGGWGEYEVTPSIDLGHLSVGTHTLQVQASGGSSGVQIDYIEFVSHSARSEERESIAVVQCEDYDFATNAELVVRSAAVDETAVHLSTNGTVDGTLKYYVDIPRDLQSARLRLRYSDDMGPNLISVFVDDELTAKMPSEYTYGWNSFWDSHELYLGPMTAGVHEIMFMAWRQTHGVDLDEFEIMDVSYRNLAPVISLDASYNFAAGSQGTISVGVSDGDGDRVALTATEAPTGATLTGYNLSWTPGISDIGTTSTVAFMADDHLALSNSVVTATTLIIVPEDYDADGMPDSWELTNFGDLDETASGDYDSDGYTNLEEYQGGTDPTDDTDYPAVSLSVVQAETNVYAGSEWPLWLSYNTRGADATLVCGIREDGSLMDEDAFDDQSTSGWTINADANISWSETAAGYLQATVVGSGGYAYIMRDSLNLTNLNFTLEYDVMFDDGADEGGIVFKDHVLYVNPTLCGWADSYPYYYTGNYGLTTGVWHHVTLHVRDGDVEQVSDLLINGEAVFVNEEIDFTNWVNQSVGFLSPYNDGTVKWDNFRITDEAYSMESELVNGAVTANVSGAATCWAMIPDYDADMTEHDGTVYGAVYEWYAYFAGLDTESTYSANVYFAPRLMVEDSTFPVEAGIGDTVTVPVEWENVTVANPKLKVWLEDVNTGSNVASSVVSITGATSDTDVSVSIPSTVEAGTEYMWAAYIYPDAASDPWAERLGYDDTYRFDPAENMMGPEVEIVVDDVYDVYNDSGRAASTAIYNWNGGSYTFNENQTGQNAPEGTKNIYFTGSSWSGWGIFTTNGERDMSTYTNGYLRFWVKSSDTLKIELEGPVGSKGIRYIASSGGVWKEYSLSIAGFANINPARMTSLFLCTSDTPASNCVDNIRWTLTP